MIETLSVSLSGPAFSFLLYENMKNIFSQEGFLLGEIVQKETRTITDNDQRQLHVSTVVKINSVVPCPQTCFFYNGVGRVNTEKIKNFLGDLTSKVVAWYKYRPSSGFNFTFRERIVHKQLAELFELPSEFFTCCLLISESSDNGSTHSFTQNFVRYNNHGYEQLPLHIVNLSDPNNTYKSPEKVSETFLNIVEGLKINHKKSQGLNIITKIQNALQKHTNNIVEDLSEAESRLFQLENEIKKIKEIVKTKDLTSASNKDSHVNDVIMMDTNSTELSPITSPVKTKHLTSASNKESHLNDVIMMDTNSPDQNECTSKRSTRGRGKAIPNKGEKRVNQSPSKKNNPEGTREITTRLRKRT